MQLCWLFLTLPFVSSFARAEDEDPKADKIEVAFCYIDWKWSHPNTNVYAQTKEEADKKAKEISADLTYCHKGPCKVDDKPEPTEPCDSM